MVSVQSSSSNLGFVRNSSDLSRSFFTYEDVIENIDITLAGRAAEEVVFGADRVSVGAWGDIEQTTDLAYEVSVLLI
jgi:ATP-dependent Zn protease